jgi:hypothetical protein
MNIPAIHVGFEVLTPVVMRSTIYWDVTPCGPLKVSREPMETEVHPFLSGFLYRVSQEERSIFWEVIVSAIPSKKVYMYMCPIPTGFRDRAISLYSSKIVDKKDIAYCF